ncbi:hypothetical protein OJAV_G00223910 [Oryzias javanicus]|uniref:Uncharacterized protein n=1 Tax=Oryzias javanicus TaxID=123683 RepID=A0A437C2N2_ORYJA|nr:hypothetical protein OJAV_G00223910 [Oryzias javanicus]
MVSFANVVLVDACRQSRKTRADPERTTTAVWLDETKGPNGRRCSGVRCVPGEISSRTRLIIRKKLRSEPS